MTESTRGWEEAEIKCLADSHQVTAISLGGKHEASEVQSSGTLLPAFSVPPSLWVIGYFI